MPGRSVLRPKELLEGIGKRWNLLLHAGTSVMATIASFWVPPPPDLPSDNETMVSFGKFVVVILAGLMILPMMKWSKKKHAGLWGIITAASLILGIIAFFSFQYLVKTSTVKHGDKVLYIGTEVREDVKSFIDKHPGYGKEELLENAGWNPKMIWTEKSLDRRRLILSMVYVLCIPFFAIAIMAVVQLIYCAGSRSGSPRRRRQTAPGRSTS